MFIASSSKPEGHLALISATDCTTSSLARILPSTVSKMDFVALGISNLAKRWIPLHLGIIMAYLKAPLLSGNATISDVT